MCVIKKCYIWATVLFVLIIPLSISAQALKTVEDWIALLANGDVIERREAAQMLGEIGGDEAVSALIYALIDEDYSVVKYSMDSLAEISDERGIEPIIEKLASGEKWIRKKAEESLIAFGERAVPYITYLLDAEKPWLREEAIKVLTGIGDTTMVHMVRFLINDPDTSVMSAAVDYVVQAEDYEAIPFMLRQMERMNIMVNEKIKTALLEMGDGVIPYISDSVDSFDPYIREGVCVVLGKLGGEAEILQVMGFLSDPEIFVRKRAVDVLKGRVDEFESLIIAESSSEESLIRMGVNQILSKSDTYESKDVLLRGLEDSDYRVREASAMSLGERKVLESVEFLVELLDDRFSEVRRASVWAIGEIGESSSLKSLIEHFDNEKYGDVRAEICYALVNLRGADVEELLIKALDDDDDRVREASAIVMGELASSVFISALKKARFDDDVDVQEAVFDALRAIGTPEALDALHY